MITQFNEYKTSLGEVILYTGKPNFKKIEELSTGFGDVWHSSFEQGFKNAFPEIVYQTATFFWYVKDLDNIDLCVSWRINPFAFAIRKSVWDELKGFDLEYENPIIQAFDFGFNAVRNNGGVVLYSKMRSE